MPIFKIRLSLFRHMNDRCENYNTALSDMADGSILESVRSRIKAGKEISFDERRQLIDDLQLTFKLVRIDGQKTVLIYWAIYETELDLDSDPRAAPERRTHRLHLVAPCRAGFAPARRWTLLDGAGARPSAPPELRHLLAHDWRR